MGGGDSGDVTIVQVPKKSTSATFKHALRLPFAMLKDMHAAKVAPFAAPGTEISTELAAVVYVEESTYYDGPVSSVQEPLSREGQQLREFFMWPMDFYEVTVEKCWRIQQCEDRRIGSEHKRGPAAKKKRRIDKAHEWVSLSEPCLATFELPMDLDDATVELSRDCDKEDASELAGPLPLRSVLEVPSAALPVLILPQCMCEMIVAGHWSNLGILARWDVKLLPEWPPDAWVEKTWNVHERKQNTWPETHHTLDPDLLDKCVEVVQKAATRLDRDLDDDDRRYFQTGFGYIVMYLQNVSVGLRDFLDSRRSTRQWPPETTFAMVMALKHLSNQSSTSLKCLLHHAAPAVMPAPLVEFWRIAAAENPALVPSTETCRESRLLLEAAFMLLARKSKALQGSSIYLWWDATARKREFLLSQASYIKDEHVLEVFAAVQSLAQARGEAPGDSADMQTLRQHIKLFTFVPVMLGLRCTSLAQKIGGFMHQLCLVCDGKSALEEFLTGIVSITTDMGTELGLAEWHTDDINSLVPEWIRPATMQDDTVVLEDRAAVAQRKWDTTFMLQWAMPIAGMMHITSNLLLEVHSNLKLFQPMSSKLEELGKLLCKPQRRDRFIRTCLVGTCYEPYEPMFQYEFTPMHDKRWFSVLFFMKRVVKVLPYLRDAWSPQRYQRGHGGSDGADLVDDDNFKVSSITNALGDKLLQAFMTMLLALDSLTSEIGTWAEGCDCHDTILKQQPTRHKRKQAMMGIAGTSRKQRRRSATGKQQQTEDTCPRKGKRSAAMASGKCDVFLARLAAVKQGEMLEAVRWGLTEEQ